MNRLTERSESSQLKAAPKYLGGEIMSRATNRRSRVSLPVSYFPTVSQVRRLFGWSMSLLCEKRIFFTGPRRNTQERESRTERGSTDDRAPHAGRRNEQRGTESRRTEEGYRESLANRRGLVYLGFTYYPIGNLSVIAVKHTVVAIQHHQISLKICFVWLDKLVNLFLL
jgi:hypothetical protein